MSNQETTPTSSPVKTFFHTLFMVAWSILIVVKIFYSYSNANRPQHDFESVQKLLQPKSPYDLGVLTPRNDDLLDLARNVKVVQDPTTGESRIVLKNSGIRVHETSQTQRKVEGGTLYEATFEKIPTPNR